MEAAFREGRVRVTIEDFAEFAVLRGTAHCGILRLVHFRAAQQAIACLQILAAHGADLQSAAIITAEPGRLKIRR